MGGPLVDLKSRGPATLAGARFDLTRTVVASWRRPAAGATAVGDRMS
jgi:hypothetical protein